MKILIIRFSSFGDIILTTPVIKKIKEKYPEAIIDFIVYDVFSEAISLNPHIRNVIIFEKKKSKDKEYIKKIINELKSESYDYVIDLHSKFLSRIIGKSLENSHLEFGAEICIDAYLGSASCILFCISFSACNQAIIFSFPT